MQSFLHRDWHRLEEAEERYQNREARDEDLVLIDQLNGTVHRLETSVKQLTVSSMPWCSLCDKFF